MRQLPPGFADLEMFVDRWALDDVQARFRQRYESDMKDITAFYEAMMPRAEEALAALEGQSLTALEGQWLRLYQLTMALAHVALAVERHGQPRPASAVYPTNVTIVRGSTPA